MKKVCVLTCCLAALVVYAAAGWDNISPLRDQVPLWSESFEGDMDADLHVEFRDGAKGKVEYISSESRSGRKALQITKSNYEGAIIITPRHLYTGKKGKKLQSSVYVRSVNSNFEYTMGFIRMYGKKEDLSYFKKLDGRGPGGPKMQYIVNTAPGVWERKLARYQITAATGNVITPAIVVSGMPSVSVWDDWQIGDLTVAEKAWNALRQRKRDTKNYDADMIPAAEFEKLLAADSDHTGKVVSINGRSRLLIDGKPVAPAIFKAKGSTPEKNVFSGKILENSGLMIQMNPVRFGKNPKTFGIWSKDGFDVASGVELVRKAMRASPKSNFILSVQVDPYPEFTAEHPDEVWVHHTGKVVYGHHVHAQFNIDSKKGWPWISMHSLVFRETVKARLTEFIAALKASGLSKRIVGVHIAGLHDAQFAVRHLDYGKPATAAYRKFLKEKYRTTAALEKAWKRDDISSFESIMPPKPDKSKRFLDPEQHQEEYDFLYFQKVAPFWMQEDLARHIRQCFGKDIFFIRYCMGSFSGTLNTAYDITAFLNSKEFDIICAQPPYNRRTPAVGCGVRLPMESFNRNGKMLVFEFDLRTYAAISGESELRSLGLSYASDFPMWQSINRKMVGQMIANDMGYWYLDMAPGWFAAGEIAKDIGNAARSYGKIMKMRSRWRPDTAYVADELGMLRRNLAGYYYNFEDGYVNGEQTNLLASSGVPYDMFLMDDVLKDPSALQRYKTVVFGGMYHVDAAREKVIRSLKSENRTLIFLGGSGRLGGSEITGFKITELPAPQDHEIVPEPGEVNMLSAMAKQVFVSNCYGKKDSYSHPGRFHAAEAPGVTVHARYKKDNAPAAVSRQFAAYRTVYICDAGGLTPEFFNKLVTEAGGFVAARPGLQLDMNGNFISIHCIIPGKYTIKLPGKRKVVNMRNGKTVTGRSGKFSIDAIAGSTYWFSLHDPEK